MQSNASLLPANRFLFTLPALVFAAGVAGMAMSFAFLGSSHPLDVTAGAAGFIGGSVLVAGGLVSIVIQRTAARRAHWPARREGRGPEFAAPRYGCHHQPPHPQPLSREGRGEIQRSAVPVDFAAPLDVRRWVSHFRANRENRPEPDWTAPLTLSDAVRAPLVRSLEQFQLGDGGGPAYLIALDRERFLAGSEGTRELVGLWFDEEKEHARLLKGAVHRFGGRCIAGHWSFTAFCLSRKWFGVRFELTVLLLTEIASTVYYRLLLRHGEDPALRSVCRLILRDETGHVAFHRDRLARQAHGGAPFGALGAGWFCALGLAAATMLWINHAPGLRALGATHREFYQEVRRELSLFLARLRREAERG
jgi:hypothetical protein